MMLIRSDSGHLMLVSQQALAQAQQGTRSISGQAQRILTSQVCVYVSVVLLKWSNVVTSYLDSCALK